MPELKRYQARAAEGVCVQCGLRRPVRGIRRCAESANELQNLVQLSQPEVKKASSVNGAASVDTTTASPQGVTPSRS